MKDKDFQIAVSQVNSILENMPVSTVEKIPEKFRDFLKENNKEEYNIEFKENMPLNQQYIDEKTINLLGVIYRNYWCENKSAYDEVLRINQEKHDDEMRKKYTIKFYSD